MRGFKGSRKAPTGRIVRNALAVAILGALIVTAAVAAPTHDQVLRGTIERIDYDRQLLVVRSEGSDRLIRVSFEGDLRMFRFRNLQRGDFMQLRGAWLTPGLEFNAYRIEELSLR